RLRTERSVERLSEHSVQTELGEFRLYVYQDRDSLEVHIALAHGRLEGGPAPLVRVHLTDTLRDLFGVRSHARTWTLRAAMQRIIEAGSGVVIVLRQQETARELVEAVRSFAAATPTTAPTEPAPAEGAVLRTFGVGAQILKDLGVTRMRVLSAPKQMHGISAFGLEIEGYIGDAG
ncbi:MAG: bifunctional 3,4-dihydroxy-2-butanone-4-phosphate synthase/GTP cyclohydrolase II, partial [Gammaproteobacteria bacterium]|nr:bifunctional 3,4-dihydroxy-2-butanone-4-phosphate synthase/GTP cyclohydrolase II [Gammaproteobacteria bacterium]